MGCKLDSVIRNTVRETVLAHHCNVSLAVKELGISRQTFYNWAKAWQWLDERGRLDSSLVATRTYLIGGPGHRAQVRKSELREWAKGTGRVRARDFGMTDIAYAESLLGPGGILGPTGGI